MLLLRIYREMRVKAVFWMGCFFKLQLLCGIKLRLLGDVLRGCDFCFGVFRR